MLINTGAGACVLSAPKLLSYARVGGLAKSWAARPLIEEFSSRPVLRGYADGPRGDGGAGQCVLWLGHLIISAGN